MRSLSHRAEQKSSGFARSEDGSMVIFTLFIMAMMLIVGGMAVDMMRFENYRSRLQAALDRSVLAAADLDVCLDPAMDSQAVVNDYLTKAGFSAQVDNVTVTTTAASCTVSAQATINVNTIFMQMVGVDQISTPTAAVATEASPLVEISLVLDTSGSMGRQGRIEALRPAAVAFVEQMFDGVTPGDLAMSMVPYSSNVNIGQEMASAFTLDLPHDYSYCVDLPMNVYGQTALDPTPNQNYDQTPHVDPYSWTNDPLSMNARRFLCDIRPENEVIAWETNPTVLTTAISNLLPHENTSIDFGAKWGAGMLDPSMAPVVDHMIGIGAVDGAVSGQPRAYGSDGVQKILVLMTDGMNTWYHDFNPTFPYGPSDVYFDALTGTYYVDDRENGDVDGDGINNEPILLPITGLYIDTMDFDLDGLPDFPQLDWYEVFDMVSLQDQAWFFRALQQPGPTYDNWNTDQYIYGTTTQKDEALLNVCTASKNAGVTIFTIGMMIPDHSITLLESCASSPSHFYHVTDLDVASAFESIAQTVTELQLVH